MGGGFMANMFQQMESMKHRAVNDPNSVVYSESKVISMTPDASGRMRVYESSDSVRKHGEVKETRHSVRDPTRGLEEMAIGHHIGQRGHVIEKRRCNGGPIEEQEQFVGLDQSQAQQFDKEWSNATRNVVGNRNQLYDDRSQRNLPIEYRRGQERERHASPYARSRNSKKNKEPIIEEVD